MSSIMLDAEQDIINIVKVKQQFPILQQEIHQKPLIYLDNANTTQKPITVLETLAHYYLEYNANIHRGVHALSVKATDAYENTRHLIKNFINARHEQEIIFTKGATESINLIAHSFGQSQLTNGDEIIISEMEHHSNIVPWQMICEQVGARIKVLPVTEQGELDLDAFVKLISSKTKLVAITHVSNAIGTINPIEIIINIAHKHNIPVLIDGAQATSHMVVDVQKLDCDFYAFSSHKMYGPTGVGVLYGKTEWLQKLPPYQGGGDMIAEVSFEKTTYNKLPYKFEAGTPNIAGVIGFGAAIKYLTSLGMENIAAYENHLLSYATQKLQEIEGLKIIGTAKQKAAVISFIVDNIHAHDVGTIIDFEGIAIRAGHHCAMPLMKKFELPATARASFGIYNTTHDIDKLAAALIKLKRFLS